MSPQECVRFIQATALIGLDDDQARQNIDNAAQILLNELSNDGMAHKIYITQLRDGAAMRVLPRLVELAISRADELSYSPEEVAGDAWSYADAFVAERQKRYGP